MMRFLLTVTAVCLLSTAVMAQPDIEFKGTITRTIPIQTTHHSIRLSPTPPMQKTISLMNVQLSDHAWHSLDKDMDNTLRTSNLSANLADTSGAVTEKASAGRIQLGMGHVPVLNQGDHGTCATFAVTAALDAALGKGDYISQLCSLQLGQQLEQFGYTPSGWDGSLNALILNQISNFGLVTKATQQSVGCGAGIRVYPSSAGIPAPSLSLSEYHAISEPLPQNEIAWTALLDRYQTFLDETNPKKKLKYVKTALENKNRLTVSILLFSINEGFVGATGTHHAPNDTWVLTPSVINSFKKRENYAGHAMIITGFDDNAIAIDASGKQHKGLLTLRNSWGADEGDQGDFYISYDYFKSFATEILRIRALKHMG